MGFSDDLENVKAYTKAYVETNVLEKQRTLLDFEVLLQKNRVNIRGKVYAEVGGTVHVNYDRSTTTCYNYARNLNQYRYKLFSFTHSVYIYVGTVDIDISVYLRLRTDCLLYTSPSPRDATLSRMPSSA